MPPSIGDHVRVPNGLSGTLRFVGTIKGREGTFAGVELTGTSAPHGKNSGVVKGTKYFTVSKEGSGLFLKYKTLVQANLNPGSAPLGLASPAHTPTPTHPHLHTPNPTQSRDSPTLSLRSTGTPIRHAASGLALNTPAISAPIPGGNGGMKDLTQTIRYLQDTNAHLTQERNDLLAKQQHQEQELREKAEILKEMEQSIEEFNKISMIDPSSVADGLKSLKLTALSNGIPNGIPNGMSNGLPANISDIDALRYEYESRIAHLTSIISSKDSRISTLKSEFDSKRAEFRDIISTLQQQITESSEIYKNELTRLQVEASKIAQSELSNIENKYKSLLDEKNKQLSDMKLIDNYEEMTKLNMTVEEQEKLISQLKFENGNIGMLETQLEQQQLKIDSLADENKQLQTKLESMRLNNGTSGDSNGNSNSDELKLLKNTIKTLTKERNSLTSKLLTLKDKDNEIVNLQHQISTLMDDMNGDVNAKSYSEYIETQSKSLNDEVESLKDELKGKLVIEHKIEELEERIKEKDKLLEEFRIIQQQHKDKSEGDGDESSTSDSLELELLRKELELYQEENNKLHTINNTRKQNNNEIDVLTESLKALELENEKLKKQLNGEDLDDKNDLVDDEDRDKINHNDHDEIKKLKQELEKEKVERVQIEKQLSDAIDLLESSPENASSIENENFKEIQKALEEARNQLKEETEAKQKAEEELTKLEKLLEKKGFKEEELEHEIEILKNYSESIIQSQAQNQVLNNMNTPNSRPMSQMSQFTSNINSRLSFASNPHTSIITGAPAPQTARYSSINMDKDTIISRKESFKKERVMSAISFNTTPALESPTQSLSTGNGYHSNGGSFNSFESMAKQQQSIPIFSPSKRADPSAGRKLWCALCEKEGHDAIDCPFVNDD